MRRLLRTRRRKLWFAVFVATAFLYLVSQAALPARRARATLLPDRMPVRRYTDMDRRLTRAVAARVGHHVPVYCWGTASWERKIEEWSYPKLGPLSPWRAYTTPGSLPAINLPPNICTELDRLRASEVPVWQRDDGPALAWSLVGLAHEAVHATGVMNEAEAECWGMQNAPALAVELGTPAEQGRYLAWLYWKVWHPGTKPPYASRECRDGGGLDLNPGSPVWP